MASTDATAIPIKNQAYRVTFPIWDADGDLVTGAAGLDSEVSKDGGTFTDCTNEATEIATSSGIYYLDLSATEMNADTVAVIVKTSTSGAKTTALVFYPAEAGDIIVNVKQINGTNQTARDIGASVLLSSGTGTGQISLSSGTVTVGTNNDKTGYTASTVSDKTGYSLADTTSDAVIADAVWNALTASYGSASTYGALIESGNVGGGAIVSASVTAGVTLAADQAVNLTKWAGQSVHAVSENGVPVVDVHKWNGTDVSAPSTAGIPEINVKNIANAAVSTSTAQIGVNVVNAGGTAWGSGAITAASIANGAIDNATFAADVGSTAYATNIIALAADKAIQNAALATAAELAKVPKSDSTVTWNATALASIQTECTDALNAYDPPTKTEMDSAFSTTNGKIDAIDDFLDTEIAAILADTNELQTDWANGGRLDVILDAASAPSAATVADAVWDEVLSGHAGAGSAGAALSAAGAVGDPWLTTLPGSYGAGTAGKIIGDNINAPIATVDTVVDGLATELAKVPKSDSTVTWNATALASIQTECTDALNAYDPPTKTEMDSAFSTTNGKIDAVDDYVDTEVAAVLAAVDTEVAAIKAKTDNLPASPAAVGSPMTLTSDYDAAKTASSQTSVNTVDGIVDDIIVDTGTTIPATLTTIEGKIDAIAPGAGAIEWTYTVATSGGVPISGVSVWCTSDVAGTVVLQSGTTNASGVVTFWLAAGTVYVWCYKEGYNFTNPDVETVS